MNPQPAESAPKCSCGGKLQFARDREDRREFYYTCGHWRTEMLSESAPVEGLLPDSSSHTLTTNQISSMSPEQLWITLLKIEASTQNIDLSQVPECVLEHYAQQDLTIKQAIEKLTK
jgi:hypothetical protein